MKQQEVTNTGTAHYRGGFQYSGLSELSRILRQNETATEKALWEMLRKKRFKNLKFRRQHQISLYIVDFYCDELKLVLEIDGGIHLSKENKEKDMIREQQLQALGFSVFRFSNEQVLDKTDLFLKELNTIVEDLS